jgi:hypothetical protein
MKKFVPLFILLLFLGAGTAAASTYTVSFPVKMIGVGGDEIFRGDTLVRFHTDGKDPKNGIQSINRAGVKLRSASRSGPEEKILP